MEIRSNKKWQEFEKNTVLYDCLKIEAESFLSFYVRNFKKYFKMAEADSCNEENESLQALDQNFQKYKLF